MVPRTTTIGLLVTLFLVVSLQTVAAEDVSCLQKAVDKRQEDLKDAYTEYSKTMIDGITRLTTDEKDALNEKNLNYRQNNTSSALNDFGYAVNANWHRLSVRLSQVWNDYYRERYQCGFSQIPPPAYGGGYNNGVTAYCTQPVLRVPPAGCAYECANDAYGCQRCHLACRTPVSYQACGCPTVSRPVCSRDNRTYDNACLAICDGRDVWHIGVCY